MRKEVDVTITADGRDKDKIFHIREMGARPAEKWAFRALIALSRACPDIDPSMGWTGLWSAFGDPAALTRNLGRIDFKEAEPLLDEMMACITIRRGGIDTQFPLLEDDIEEIASLIKLRMEVLKLHMGF